MLLLLGCGYVLGSVLLGHGHFGDGGHAAHGHDAGGEAPSHYGVEGEGHGSASAGPAPATAFHFPFFSPLALATLLGAIGAWGLIALQGFGTSERISLLVSMPAALLTAYAVTYVGWRIVSGSRGSSQIRTADLMNATAEVITPIPAGGAGEVAAIVGGQRFNGPAREAGGRAVPRGASVTVTRVVGGTMIVTVDAKKAKETT